ncbi:MAG: HAMP domain-containing sensor histidine kinase [Pseudomonadota bacterium]
MAQGGYPYLDLTVMPALRAHAVSARAAVLFSADMDTVLWTNAMGAQLLGADNARAALDGAMNADRTMMRQLSYAAERLSGEETSEVGGMIRLKSGFKSKLLPYTLREQELPGGEGAVLLISDTMRGRNYGLDALAQETVSSLSGDGHGSALLQTDGVLLAASETFDKFGISSDVLSSLSRAMGSDADGLIKRPIETANGPLPAGMTRLMDEPVLDLLIVAEPSSDMLDNEAAPAAPAPQDSGASEAAANIEDTSPEESPEPVTAPSNEEAPRVGAFSNRRTGQPKASQTGMGRWYYKTAALGAAGAAAASADDGGADAQGDADDNTATSSALDNAADKPQAGDPDLTEDQRPESPKDGAQATDVEPPVPSTEKVASTVVSPPAPEAQERQAGWTSMQAGDDGTIVDATADETGEGEVPEEAVDPEEVTDAETVGAVSEDADDGDKPQGLLGKAASVVVAAGATAATVVVSKKSKQEETADTVESDDGAADTTASPTAVDQEPSPLIGDGDGGQAMEAAQASEGDETSPLLVLDDNAVEQEDDPSGGIGETGDIEDDGFRFTSTAKPVRFVWELDADNEFRSVSEDLASAVGPKSADVIGLKWDEAVALRRLENGEEISELLTRGDTWSGKTVLWPVEGTDLRVPIDMAGLPSYRRNRTFDGFNGFGIVRTADAVVDPNAVGLDLDGTFADNHPEGFDKTFETPDPIAADDPESGSDGADGGSLARPVGFLAATHAAAAGKIAVSRKDDDTSEEVDETTSTEPKGTDRALSQDEQETFEEIGDTLSSETAGETGSEKRAPAQGEKLHSDVVAVPSRSAGNNEKDNGKQDKAPVADEAAVIPAAFIRQPNYGTPDSEPLEGETAQASNAPVSGAPVTKLATIAKAIGAGSPEETAALDENALASGPEPEEATAEEKDSPASGVPAAKLASIAKAIGASPDDETADQGKDEPDEMPLGDDEPTGRVIKTPDHDVDTSILSRLPIPVLVYRNDDLLFGNDELFAQTGHDDLQALAKAGGVDALFGPTGQSKGGTILHRDGHTLPLRAHLQRVPWDAQKAMLLTLRKDEGGGDDGGGDVGGPDDGSDTEGDPGDTSGGDDPAPSSNDDPTGEATPTAVARKAANRVRHNRKAPHLGLVVPVADNDGMDDDEDGKEDVTGDEDASIHAEPPDNSRPKAPALYEDHEEGTLLPAFGGLEADDLRSILDTATDGVIILSDEGVVRALNKSAEALFDVKPEEITEQSLTRLLAPESHRVALDYVGGMSKPGVASVLNDGREVIGRTAKGGLIPLFMTIGKLEKTDACCAVMRDITQFKKAEEELTKAKSEAEKANRQKSDFLAVISHEIRTPLNAIIGFSDMMIEERFGRIESDRYRGYLRDINKSGNHVLSLINDLLDISKIESGNLELNFDAVGLNTIVSETVAMAQADANKERVIIRTSLSAAVPNVVADERSLKQIILNLVSNSIKFTSPGGQVIVSTFYEEAGSVVLRVRDTGVGMSAQELERAMQPFRQISNRKSEAGKGSGLGLPLTKAMVEANRAEFHIESVPDEGTLVEVHFPIQRVLADR